MLKEKMWINRTKKKWKNRPKKLRKLFQKSPLNLLQRSPLKVTLMKIQKKLKKLLPNLRLKMQLIIRKRRRNKHLRHKKTGSLKNKGCKKRK